MDSCAKIKTAEEENSHDCINTCDAEDYDTIESDDSSDDPSDIDPLSDCKLPDASDSDEICNPEITPKKRKRPAIPSESVDSFSSPATIPAVEWRGKRKSLNRSSPTFHLNTSEVKWRSSDEPDTEPRQPVFRPVREPGPQVVCSASCRPLQFFQLLFSTSVLQKIVAHTNAYGSQKYKIKWSDISIKDFKSFLALVIYMGLLKCSSITDYWRTSYIYSLPFPGRIMSARKFSVISSCLHLSHPKDDAENEKMEGTAQYDRLCKIKPLYDDIREACKSSFQPFQNISIDERMVATRARNALEQYMKNEPENCDYKLFVLADSLSGYTWDFFIYEGKSVLNQNNNISYSSVMTLANEKLLGSGYKLFVHNFYTSPKLFRDLLDKKIWACGTLRANRIKHSGTPGPRGNIRWFRDDKLLFVEWKDRRDVLMCSTFHKAFNGDTVKRKVKGHDGGRAVQEFPVPPAVLDYNKNMTGLDVSDALIGYYTDLHETTRWYHSFFYHFVDIAVVNAFILHQHMAREKKQKPMTQKAFREALVSELAAAGTEPDPEEDTETTSAVLHLPKYICDDSTEGRRKCRRCNNKTPIMCEICNVALCFVPMRECFTLWHKSVMS